MLEGTTGSGSIKGLFLTESEQEVTESDLRAFPVGIDGVTSVYTVNKLIIT